MIRFSLRIFFDSKQRVPATLSGLHTLAVHPTRSRVSYISQRLATPEAFAAGTGTLNLHTA